jgi:hypothetical protein
MSISAMTPAMISYALAQAAVPVAATPPTDFTPVVVAIVGGAFSVIGIVATTLINSRMKDTKDAATLTAAIGNSLGAVQNAIDAGLRSHPLQATLPVSPSMAAGVQYVINHAGDVATRLGVSSADIADKIDARLGLAKIPAASVSAAPAAGA